MSSRAHGELFDVCGPLPAGVTVLEASAGTGKTYTIAALAARYVAAGVPLSEILLVTFGRMATTELRERVRERLVSSERTLSRALAGFPGADDADPVDRLLSTGAPEELRERARRLTAAVTEFDAATIATVHRFCQDTLADLGILADHEPDATFTERMDDLRDEVVDDLYLRAFRRLDGRVKLPRGEIAEIASLVTGNPQARIVPEAAPPASAALRRARAAAQVRAELELRKRRLGLFGYDDMLTRLQSTLAGANGEAAVRQLRRRYRVVLVDEFQDTDPVQWDILHRAFRAGGATLVLIADPKQAIYFFRGADVYAYLRAARAAEAHHSLEVNWRSDETLIRAHNELFRGADLGHPEIVYRQVRPAPGHLGSRLRSSDGAALELRLVPRDAPEIRRRKGWPTVTSTRPFVARDVAGTIAGMLRASLERESRNERGELTGVGRIGPGDIAVLVSRHYVGHLVHDALRELGIPGVMGGAESVFGTPAAREWRTLLRALEQPASSSRARAAALTSFLGLGARELADPSETALEAIHRSLHRWAALFRAHGIAALLGAIERERRLPERLLGVIGGERQITDLRHVGQLLHQTVAVERLGLAALLGWLERRMESAEEQNSDEERSRRLESDDDAVQIMTIHRSKGLEFPVVLCPDLWDVRDRLVKEDLPVAYHDPDRDDELFLDVGLDRDLGYQRHRELARDEQLGERLRLTYVALTRAMHRTIVWWAGIEGSEKSGISRLLFDREPGGAVKPRPVVVPIDAAAEARMRELAERVPGCVSVERCAAGPAAGWAAEPRPHGDLAPAAFTRTLDLRWRRASYTSITAEAPQPHVASEPEASPLTDEPEAAEPVPAAAGGKRAGSRPPSPMTDLPVGTSFGTVIHRVLERVDFDSPALEEELAGALAGSGGRLLDAGERAMAASALCAALETPLGPLADERSLRQVPRRDRLDELVFELPLVGGDEPTGSLTLAAIARLLAERLPPADPLAGYADRLRDPALAAELRGYLTGSIDLLVRLWDPPGTVAADRRARFAVLDYKTNWLGAAGPELSILDYAPAALRAEMLRSHYALQGLLYSVAAHRFLRWRNPAHDPARDFAGVFYLFLRGMAGAGTPVADGGRCGVFAWRPPAGLIEALSDLLDTGAGR